MGPSVPGASHGRYDVQASSVICFLGTSHAAETLEEAALFNGLVLVDDPYKANLVIVAEDTPTGQNGERDLQPILALVEYALNETRNPVVLSSQVPPGFTRGFQSLRLFHMAETLRIKDAQERARNPEQLIIGCWEPMTYNALPEALRIYCEAFSCPVTLMCYEDAEFAKIAINMFLASQVDTTNRLAEAAQKSGASWPQVVKALVRDKRIGPYAYLEPGRWQDSPHLLRDHVTLEGILAR